MTGFRLSPNTRRFLLWTARLAFLAYFLQIIAVDHWHSHPLDVFGLEGTAAHVAHCHGAGDCSDGGAVASPAIPREATLPGPPPLLQLPLSDNGSVPSTVFTETPLPPPKTT